MREQNATAINTLARLNTVLGAFTHLTNAGALPLTTASFNNHGNPTAAEIDTAIATANDTIVDYLDVQDIIASVDQELADIVADPAGYQRFEYGGLVAYFDDNGFDLNDQAERLLLNSAHNQGDSRHQSANCNHPPQNMDWYIHIYADNTLYAVQYMGLHRGIPMVRVLAEGNVNAGNHNF